MKKHTPTQTWTILRHAKYWNTDGYIRFTMTKLTHALLPWLMLGISGIKPGYTTGIETGTRVPILSITATVIGVNYCNQFVWQRLERQWADLHWTRHVSAAVRLANSVSSTLRQLPCSYLLFIFIWLFAGYNKVKQGCRPKIEVGDFYRNWETLDTEILPRHNTLEMQ